MRNLSVTEAQQQLSFSQLKAGRCLKKVLDSAVANAELHDNVKREQLNVIEVRVDAGPVYKRAKSKSRGGRSPILKRTSHLTVVVGEKER
ncbi:ribosomal L22p/L17e family protein [Chlamydia psittaci 04DC42]|nr:50S ribosomal subunit protein L22 [Chlamydia psittaci 84/55]AFS20211.1 50S ribosomal subunit protein L22 [Chlamydia psittaci GR9]AFS22291.1 50S ribosomal subunit protein L22 [Chlamydia psittaci VS225]AFS23556.1 50S ribosomal subunit protein L22 [Chlamydia psittaci WS/RT/E30]AFS25837.1 50S ribosomal subunit protein L22 [Chlamydia psittaci WC]AFS27640.1 50S ribosomal subunit protein L22 [Chlamydia psittaci NJ1]EGF85314.1 50S ribosomal subunit protein L22 [Chlamydia psittaci Cal10]EPJ14056.1